MDLNGRFHNTAGGRARAPARAEGRRASA